MSSDYEKLKKLYDQIDNLLKPNITSFSPEFKVWRDNCLRFLSNRYGEKSVELSNFKKIYFSAAIIDSQQQYIYFRNGLETAKGHFEDLLEDLEKENKTDAGNSLLLDNNVFIVHGHAKDLKYQVSNLLRKIGLNPIILHEQINSSRTIIEKIEKHGKEASAAVVLFTPDDFGNVKTEKEKNARARQNVVFEAGYFMGLLGRDRVILVVSDKSIELPGDLSGVVYSETSEWDIARELKAIGLNVDLNKLM